MPLVHLAVIVVVMATLCGVPLASNYIVGDSAGWGPDTACHYMTWAGNKNFYVGDTLEFDYDPKFYNVLEVTKQDYDSCNVGAPIRSYNTGKDAVPLSTPGEHYFICSSTCTTGNMQFFITVQNGGAQQLPPPQGGSGGPQQIPPPPPPPPDGSGGPQPPQGWGIYPPDCIDKTTHTPIAGCIPTWVPVPYTNGTNPFEKSGSPTSVVSPTWLSLSLFVIGVFAARFIV